MDSKPIWQSKTFWLNVAGLAVAFAVNHYTELGIPIEYQMTVLGMLNIVNRFLTSTPVTLA